MNKINKAIVLVSNSIDITSINFNKLDKFNSVKFVYHNLATPCVQLQNYYPPVYSESLFLMRNSESGFWGLDAASKNTNFMPKNKLLKTDIFFLHTDDIQSINVDYEFSSHFLNTQMINDFIPSYPMNKIPTCGCTSRFYYMNSIANDPFTQIFTIGFNLNSNYVTGMWDGHGWSWEFECLYRDLNANKFTMLDNVN